MDGLVPGLGRWRKGRWKSPSEDPASPLHLTHLFLPQLSLLSFPLRTFIFPLSSVLQPLHLLAMNWLVWAKKGQQIMEISVFVGKRQCKCQGNMAGRQLGSQGVSILIYWLQKNRKIFVVAVVVQII